MLVGCPGPIAQGLDVVGLGFWGASFHMIIWQLATAKLKAIFKLAFGPRLQVKSN